MTIPTNPLPYDPVNGCHTIKINNKTRSTDLHPTHLSFSPPSLPRNPKFITSKNHPITLMHPSSPHPLNSHIHWSSSYSPTLPNPIHHCRSLSPANILNNLHPSTIMSSKATQATLHTKAALHTKLPTIQTLCHQLPPKPQYPQQNLGKVIPMPAWTKWNDHIQCIQPINLLSPSTPFCNQISPLNSTS